MARLRKSDAFEAELRNDLGANGFDATTVEQVMSQLKERRLLDDTRTIENFVAHRTGKRAAGPEKLRAELTRRGAPEALIESALASQGDEQRRQDMATLLAARCKREGPRAKGARLLLSRGYEAGAVEQALDEFYGSLEC